MISENGRKEKWREKGEGKRDVSSRGHTGFTIITLTLKEKKLGNKNNKDLNVNCFIVALLFLMSKSAPSFFLETHACLLPPPSPSSQDYFSAEPS